MLLIHEIIILKNSCSNVITQENMTLGGALEKWPIFKSLLITLRTGDMLVIMIVMVIMNFEAKKLSGRSPCSA
jgi:hypothetical protein